VPDDGENEDVEEQAPIAPSELVDLLEVFLLGSRPTLTGPEVADRVGISLDVAKERWRSLGFTTVPDDEVAFTEADVHALELTQRMHDLGLVEADDEAALIRTLGRSFARLAEWQMTLLGRTIDVEHMRPEAIGDLVLEVRPVLEEVMSYVWRRHALGAATRRLLSPTPENEGTVLGVGFADIVDYTRQSRSLRSEELARLVEEFESTALEVITEHRGRIIKTIGDEVLFVADTPADAAEIGLLLVERHVEDGAFPQLRVGIAYGAVLARLGDVFGPVVNLAARLTSTARPGRVLVDRGMAEHLRDDERYRVRRTRRTTVKGYRRLEPWSLRRPMGADPAFDSDKLPGPASRLLAERGRDLVRAVEEMHVPLERPADGEGAE
jgi:adenylate cyclase